MLSLVGALDVEQQQHPQYAVNQQVAGGPLQQSSTHMASHIDSVVAVTTHPSALLNAVSWAATITTISVGLTGINICMKIRRKGNVGDISPAPFVVGVANALLWIRYGMIVNDSTILTVNWVGGVLQTSYVTCYYYYAVSKHTLYKYLFVCGLIFAPCYIYSLKASMPGVSPEDIISIKNLVGTVASCAAISFCAAPLAQMKVVIRSRSTETMSFLLALATFLMSVEWFFYGYLISDKFVEIPNFIGSLLGAAQLFLFYKYPTSSTTKPITQLPM